MIERVFQGSDENPDFSFFLTVSKKAAEDQYKALKEERDKLAPKTVLYQAAMTSNRCTRKIMDLFGGRKKFEAIPIMKSRNFTPSDMSYPIMRGEFGEETNQTKIFFITRVIRQNIQPVSPWADLYLQSSVTEETWSTPRYGTFDFDGLMIDKGNSNAHNLEQLSLLSRLIRRGEVEFQRASDATKPPIKYSYKLV